MGACPTLAFAAVRAAFSASCVDSSGVGVDAKAERQHCHEGARAAREKPCEVRKFFAETWVERYVWEY